MYRIIIDCKSYDLQSYILSNTSINTKANTSDVNSSISSLNSQISTISRWYNLSNNKWYKIAKSDNTNISWNMGHMVVAYKENIIGLSYGHQPNNAFVDRASIGAIAGTNDKTFGLLVSGNIIYLCVLGYYTPHTLVTMISNYSEQSSALMQFIDAEEVPGLTYDSLSYHP